MLGSVHRKESRTTDSSDREGDNATAEGEVVEEKPVVKYPVSNAHRFICALNEKKKLLRNYSQNIDGLELLAGLEPRKLVQVHGTIDTLKCTACKKRKTLNTCIHDILAGGVLRCSCKKEGIMKPEITFFGERLPDAFFRAMKSDLHATSLVIVMGTSLKVKLTRACVR